MNRYRIALLSTVLLLLVLAACSDDETPIVGPDVASRGAPDPTTLVQWWQTAYSQMDVTFLASLLDPAYTAPVPASALADLAWLPEDFDRAGEIRMADRMFSGISLVAPDGSFLPAATDIVFEVLNPQGTWSEIPAGQPYAGSLAEFFTVSVLVIREEFSAVRTSGLLRFFAAPYDTTVGGEAQTWYTLAGMIDLTGPLATEKSESVTWASLRGLWWTGP